MRISDWSSDVCSSDLASCEPSPSTQHGRINVDTFGTATICTQFASPRLFRTNYGANTTKHTCRRRWHDHGSIIVRTRQRPYHRQLAELQSSTASRKIPICNIRHSTGASSIRGTRAATNFPPTGEKIGTCCTAEQLCFTFRLAHSNMLCQLDSEYAKLYPRATKTLQDKIGRASCRERVCQYV